MHIYSPFLRISSSPVETASREMCRTIIDIYEKKRSDGDFALYGYRDDVT